MPGASAGPRLPWPQIIKHRCKLGFHAYLYSKGAKGVWHKGVWQICVFKCNLRVFKGHVEGMLRVF